MPTANLSVRPLEAANIPLIADYWTKSDPDYMIGMGVDLAKLPTAEGLYQMLTHQLQLPYDQKAAYALIWLIDEKPVGHSNINNIQFGDTAAMHLHLWQADTRQQGAGTSLVKQSLPYYFEHFQLKTLSCEPYALNPAPHRVLEKVGFTFEKTYTTVPGSINFEQAVKRWVMSHEQFKQKLAP